MSDLQNQIMMDMVRHEHLVPHRTQHFLKVYAFTKMIGQMEGLDEATQQLLEITALMHDIGIRPSLTKYQSSAGPYQEAEGPPIARELLEKYKLDPVTVDRICFLIGHHHTYSHIDHLDYQILVEADFLVNIFEDKMSKEQIDSIRSRIFKTKTGLYLLDQMF